jgi:hypothetical protein
VADSAEGRRPGQVEDAGGLYDGFEAYRTPSDEDYRGLLTEGVVVPDTNVFLNLYRYNEQTRDDLFTVLRGLGDRLWVPRQVMVEFWRNRESVLRDPRDTDKTAKELSAQRDEAVSGFRAWANRVGLALQRTSELAGVLAEAFGKVIDGVSELADDDATDFARNTGKDPVLAGLEPILRGRVGTGLRESAHEKALAEAKRRAEAQQPPGYKDLSKGGTGLAGDYLIWVEVLEEAQRRKRDVLIVTGDVKEDWWRRERGELRGPRPELVEEMRQAAGVRLFMLRPESLVVHARQVLRVQVRDESVQDIERVADNENGGWTTKALAQLLSRLSAEGWSAQEQAIRMAGIRDGFVSRDIVYALGGYDEGRSLRGFTRPVSRITREFREHAIIPESATDVLSAEYDPASSNPGWASGFSIPKSLIPLILELARPEPEAAAQADAPADIASALKEFRALGHEVGDEAAQSKESGRPQWRCLRCGSHLSIDSADQSWTSPTGRSPCQMPGAG